MSKKEISIIEIKEDNKIRFKVTKRIPELLVAETKVFETKEEAKKQFEEWLQ